MGLKRDEGSSGHEKEKNVKIDYLFGPCAIIINIISHLIMKRVVSTLQLKDTVASLDKIDMLDLAFW